MKRSRGLVLFMALVLMGLVTAMMTDVVGHAGIEISRTNAAADDAQLSQLLIAGTTAARSAARAGQFSDADVPAPTGRIRLTWGSDHACTIDAAAGQSHRSVVLDAVKD